MGALELKIPPLVLLGVFAAAMYVVSRLAPGAAFGIPGRGFMAIGLAVVGAMVAGAGVMAFRRNKTTVNPLTPAASSALVDKGVYRFSRNPMYLGFLVGLGAWGIWLSNAASAFFLVVFVVYMNEYQIKPEERALSARFGAGFEHYCARVRRWI